MHRPNFEALSILQLVVVAAGLLPVSSLLTPKPTTARSLFVRNSSAALRNKQYASPSQSPSKSRSTTRLSLTPLPKDISPFDKSASKGRDIQGDIRKLATVALEKALPQKPTVLELEFPPLIGGEQSKTQFDDFDNVQELNKNRDFCVEWLPTLSNQAFNNGDDKSIWFVLPDTKEVELCKEEWKGNRYRSSAVFSSIEAVANHYFTKGGGDGDSGEGYNKPWGATFANAFNQLVKGGGGDDDDDSESTFSTGLLGDDRALDSLDGASASLHLVCQPGNGGPVEDWINVKKLHERASNRSTITTPTIVVNGALDKVRDGYYAPFIFPVLAKTFDFYKSFEPLVFLKPVSDKGLYGWLFKVYGEPWQIYLQKPRTIEKASGTSIEVEDISALVSETRPSYQECIQALLKCNAENS